MSALTSAALLLSVALLVFPSSPRGRLTPAVRTRRLSPLDPRWLVRLAGCVAVSAAVLLPLTTVLAVLVVGATGCDRYRRR